MKKIKEFLEAINGYKTYSGLIVTVLGMTGLAKYILPEGIAVLVNGGFEIVGILLTIIGAIHKDIKIVDASEN